MQDPLENKKFYLIVSPLAERAEAVKNLISKQVKEASFFYAKDGLEALAKAENHLPHMIFSDYDLPKLDGESFLSQVLAIKKSNSVAFILMSDIPEPELLVDQVVTGQLQFLLSLNDEERFAQIFAKAIHFTQKEGKTEFNLKSLPAGEILMNEGDKGDYVYILRKGQLQAFKHGVDHDSTLGLIEPGEFVGEMSYINGEVRSASVKAVVDSELIMLPIDQLDHILFAKPSWSKALMKNLSKRLKAGNESIS